MSADVVIRAEGLGKKYVIGHQKAGAERYTSLRDVIARSAHNLVRTTRDMLRGRQIVTGDEVEEFWALRDLDFEIRRGEVVGIIGRNGAGKSTLLKVLSRITEPTAGLVEIHGRVASLLEVGTGFHPELTGRENIFLNGAILGMSRAEIKRKFDEIVAFAEVERFLDTPVKRYSSGMYVRLAFAVAAHLEPEILVVDEVLAVGDAEFQKKCLGKMQDVAEHGRTVLFVSHNMSAISTLCSRGLLISGGRLAFAGDAAEVMERYSYSTDNEYDVAFPSRPDKPTITRIMIERDLLASRDLKIVATFESPSTLRTPIGGILIRALSGEPIWASNGRFHPRVQEADGLASGILTCEVKGIPLRPGQYLISMWLGDWYKDYDAKIDCIRFTINDVQTDKMISPQSIQGYLDWGALWRAESI